MEHNFTSNHKHLENSTFSFTCKVHRFRLMISVVAYYCAYIRSSLNYAYAILSCTCTYPVVNDLWGVTDVATLFLHFILFSASLTASQNFNLVYLAIFFLPTLTFVVPFFSVLALFLVKSSWQALMILIHAQTTLTCVSLLWVRYHHRAQWLA